MPAPIPFAVRPSSARGADAPPPPPPDWMETMGAGFRTARDDVAFVQRERLDEAYRPIVDTLGERGDGGHWWFTNPVAVFLPFQDRLDHDRIWTAVEAARRADPRLFADLPKTREEFEQGVLTRQGARAQDLRTVAEGSGVASFIGGIGAMPFDPVNVATAPLGGAANTVWQAALREALINGAIEAVQQVPLAMARDRMGEELTGEEAVLNIGAAAVFGGLLGGASKYASSNWDAIKAAPRDAQERLWGAILERSPWLRERVGSSVDWDALDPHLPTLAEDMVGRDAMSEAEVAAADWLRRGAQVEAASPFVPNGAAADLHGRLLGEAMRRVLDDGPATSGFAPSSVRAKPEVGLASSTAISSRTVQVDAPGAQQAFMQRVRRAESGGSDMARNPRSSATGRYQFTDGTWLAYYKRRYGDQGLSDAAILAKRGDGDLQDVLMRDLTADNAAFLRNRGEAVSEGNLYLVHFAGQGGARRIFDADPATPIEDVLGAAVVKANPHLRGMTAGDTIAWAHRAMGAAPSRRAGARAEVGEQVREDSIRQQLQEEIDGITARLDQLASQRGADGAALPDVAAGGSPVRIDPIDLPELLDAPELRARDPELADDSPVLPELRRVVDDRRRSLHDIEALAAELGASGEEVRRALGQLVQEGRLVQRRDTGGFMRKPPAPARAEPSLLEFVARRGGIEDRGGDFAAMGAERWHREAPFRARLLRPFDDKQANLLAPGARREHSAEAHFEAAISAGYFPEFLGRLDQAGKTDMAAEKPDVAVFMAAVERELRGDPRFAVDARKGEFAEREGGEPGPMDEAAEAAAIDAYWARYDRLSGAAVERYKAVLLPEDVAELEILLREGTDLLPPRAEVGDLTDDELAPYIGEWLNRKIDEALDAARIEAEDAFYDWRELEDGEVEGGGGRPAAFGDDARAGPADARAGASPLARARGDAETGYADGVAQAALAPEQRAPFLDPEGDAAKAQADSLFHDAKATIDPDIAARQAQEAQLGAEAPLRADAAQESTLGLGLFGAADGVRLDPEGEARPIRDLLDEIDAEAAEIKAIRDCL